MRRFRAGVTRAGGAALAAVLIACTQAPGAGDPVDAAVDAATADSGPPPTSHVVLLHTADTVGYLEPCG